MWQRLNPAQSILAFFILTILTGSLLLSLPISSADSAPFGFSNYLIHLFTATSAVCVTGLTVVDTGGHYTLFGQIVILFLIQIGALGYVTFVTAAGIIFGKLPIKERLAIKEVIDPSTFEGLLALLKQIIKITLAIEAAGAVVLAVLFSRYFSIGQSLYYGIFHSVSAFANAGFSVFPSSFESFRTDIPMTTVLCILIVLGGIGFMVIKDIIAYKKGLSIHTKMVLVLTGFLILAGALAVYVFERNNPSTLFGKPLGQKIADSLFQSITSRTAGFNTIPVAGMHYITLFFVMALMFIGASPGGTGGGIKTTTFGIVFLWIISFIRGKENVNVFSRKIPAETISRAILFFLLGTGIISAMFMAFLFFERSIPPANALFEVFSAYGTVGLSTGITASLSAAGRLIIIFTMITGRIGPLTLVMSAVSKKEKDLIQYSEERVLVG